MKGIITEIIKYLLVFFCGCFVQWLWNKIINKKPLNIKINSQHLSALSHLDVINRNHPLSFWMPINFENRTSSGFDIEFSKFKVYLETIQQFDLVIQNRIYEEKVIGIPPMKFSMTPKSSKTAYLYVSVTPSKEYTWEEFRKLLDEIKNKSVVIKFNYIISIDSKEWEWSKEIKDFFINLKKLIEKF